MDYLTDDRVRIKATFSDLDGRDGTILGLSMDHIVRIWIVGLDEPYENNGRVWKAVTLPGGLLERIAAAKVGQ